MLCSLWRAILWYHWSYDWSCNWTLNRTTETWIYRHRWITTPKDCLTDHIFAISELLNIKTDSRTDIHGLYKRTSGQCYIWFIRDILPDYVLKTSHYWALLGYAGY